jgi:hypothetical protein
MPFRSVNPRYRHLIGIVIHILSTHDPQPHPGLLWVYLHRVLQRTLPHEEFFMRRPQRATRSCALRTSSVLSSRAADASTAPAAGDDRPCRASTPRSLQPSASHSLHLVAVVTHTAHAPSFATHFLSGNESFRGMPGGFRSVLWYVEYR